MTGWKPILGILAAVIGCIALESRADQAPVAGVASQATASEGQTLVLGEYVVPVDGVLVVRLGAQGRLSESVTFAGVEMLHASSLEATYAATLSAEIFYLPVQAGQAGPIVATYLAPGTDAKSLVAVTLPGEHALAETQSETAGGPNLAELEISAAADAVVLSSITIHGNGIPAISGAGHTLDGYPTVPETIFHEMKHLGGHLAPGASGGHTVSYQNTRPTGWMDYALIAAAFTPVPEPGFWVGIWVGCVALAGRIQGKRVFLE